MAYPEAAEFLNSIHETLACQSDLSPENPKVNNCLSRLVATLQNWQRCGYGSDLADHPDFAGLAEALPALCAKAECEMEKWWCQRILASDCKGMQALAAFWYLDNYEALCRTELGLLGNRCKGCFVLLGSGALPLTAILLTQQAPNIEITCVDSDGEACTMAQELIPLLGLSEQITIEHADACSYRPSADKTIICTSLLDAPGVFSHLDACHIKRLLLRDAEGPYRFCYRPARLPGAEFVQRAKSSLSTERINTSRYFEARPS